MKVFGSVASLVEAVREDVDAEALRIRRETEEAERRESDGAERERIELPDRGERLAEERRKAAEVVAREDWTDRREALERREAFAAEAARRGLEALRSGTVADRAELLGRLAREAIERVPGDVLEIVVNAADAALVTGELRVELARSAGRREVRLSPDRLETAGGCVLRTADGRTSFDDTFEARAKRFATAWRSAIAEIQGP